MSDWPQTRAFDISPLDDLSVATALLGLIHTTSGSTAWPTANLAILVPVRNTFLRVVTKLVIGAGATAAGNFDVGIYDAGGNRLVSSGATAKGSSTEHVIDVADTVLIPGLYYLAMSADGTNNYQMVTASGTVPLPLQKTRLAGVLNVATSYPLPATLTPAAATVAPVPLILALSRPY